MARREYRGLWLHFAFCDILGGASMRADARKLRIERNWGESSGVGRLKGGIFCSLQVCSSL